MRVSTTVVSKDNIIKSYFDNPKKFDPFCKDLSSYVKEQREIYLETSLTNIYQCWDQIYGPLNLKNHPNYHRNFAVNPNKDTSGGITNILEFYKGLWVFRVYKKEYTNRYDFSISVAFGTSNGHFSYSYHPDAIQDFITEKFGKSVYQEWKQDVLDDLDSLEEIVHAAKKNINRLIPSIVTSRRSKQLCELVDIEVVDDWAFLYPTK